MKSRSLFSWALTALGVLPAAALLAQPSGCPPMEMCLGSLYTCSLETNWVVALDLDGDGVEDFRQVRCVAQQSCYADSSLVWSSQEDKTEALFAVNGVGLYVLVYSENFGPPTLQTNELILPSPDAQRTGGRHWFWDPPEFALERATLGLGYTDRTMDEYPCPGGVPACWTFTSRGWLSFVSPALFGFRIPKPDGWHLGWLQLELIPPTITPDGRYTLLRLSDYAVHPEPNTEIRAGEHPRPRLSATLVSGRVTVSWPLAWTGFTLERTRALGTNAWEAAPGVTNNAVSLDEAEGPWYFRLWR